MDAELHERLAVVETQVGALTTTVNAMAVDLRVVRDHVVTVKASSTFRNRVISVGIAVLGLVFAAWQIIRPAIAK